MDEQYDRKRRCGHGRRTAALAAAFCTGMLAGVPAGAAQPFLGEIDYFAFNFAPRGWALCDGQILPISQNQSLYSLLGTTFGGDGRTSFALPDMRGRSPVHDGGSAGGGLTRRPLGQRGGAEMVTLTPAQVPPHSHSLRGITTAANQVLPTGHSLAATSPDMLYSDQAPDTAMHAGAISNAPAGAHQNMSPYLVVNCAIALQGVFPSRN
jgi:microcystin-dependent protein